MKFDKTSAADEAIKNKVNKTAKKAASKTAKKAGKAAGKASLWAARKLFMALSMIFGGVGAIFFITIILVLMILPAIIFGSTAGVDGANPDPNGTTINSIDSSWEEDAKAALDERYKQLTTTSFWDDLSTFFTTGVWGTSNETFKTEYADADDLNKDGESISPGYFSASNRMIAVINQAFRVSQDDATNNVGIFFQSPAMKRAATVAETLMNEHGANSFYAEQRAKYPQVPDENISSNILKVTNTESDYVYQSCYIVAASSSKTMDDDSVDVGMRNILDGAFYITGIDNPDGDAQKICWTPTVVPREEYREVIRVVHAAGDPYDSNGDGIDDSFYEETKTTTDYYLDLTYEYSIILSNNFKDIVNEYYSIEEDIPDNIKNSFSISQAKQVDISATELYKFYNESNVNLGVIGLPLPEGSYSIGHRFGCICSVHTTRHGGQDLPAPNGTSVFAVADGTISYTQSGRVHDTSATGKDSYGNCVFITHPDGTETRYGHLDATLVSQGDVVKAGDLIGMVGDTGYSFGNHLHFEMLSGSNRIDPMTTDVGALINQHHR